MKQKWISLSLVLLLSFMLTACTNPSSPQENETTAPEEKEQEAVKTETPADDEKSAAENIDELDLETSPFEGAGVHTISDAKENTITFIKTGEDGQDTLEYLKFLTKENTVEKYVYVPMMGRGFYYYFDLEKNEMIRMENDEHEDTTEAAKKSNRFDGPAEEMKEEVSKIQEYFQDKFGKSIADFAN